MYSFGRGGILNLSCGTDGNSTTPGLKKLCVLAQKDDGVGPKNQLRSPDVVVVVRAESGRGGAGVGSVGIAFEEPGVPFPQMEETYGGATSYAGDVRVLCSVWGGVRLCQLVIHVSLNSWAIPLAMSKASFDERPPQISCSRSHLGGERLEISGIEK